MSDTNTNATSAIFKISNEESDEHNFNNKHQFLSSGSVNCCVEYDDTLSVAYSSCSDYSNQICNLENKELNFRPNCIDNIEPSNANMRSVCVENSTNVTFGNKTYFNGPVVIKNFVVDGNNVEASKTQEECDKLNPLKDGKTCGCYPIFE